MTFERIPGNLRKSMEHDALLVELLCKVKFVGEKTEKEV